MNTPICDFVEAYIKKSPKRLHMPGHKGKGLLGFEEFDITEINGADSLFQGDGIIGESENNASQLFGCRTLYSAEGSSLAIRAMVYLAKIWGENPLFIAGRNAHKSFLSAVALLDVEVSWLYPKDSYLSCDMDLLELESLLSQNKERNLVVYLTSPDYLGSMADIKGISELCKKYNALFLVDNAHGAYLKFLPTSAHPMDLGADMCCDSAHKTLPALTGSAYLHISNNAPEVFKREGKNALSLFASTSPSYLILQSLDKLNAYLADGYRERLDKFVSYVEMIKAEITQKGYKLKGTDPLKIVIDALDYGYYGDEIGEILEKQQIYHEFSDKESIVFMVTPENNGSDINNLRDALLAIPKKSPIESRPPVISKAVSALSPRQALFCEKEIISVDKALGRILGEFNIACPPAVPLLICGEVIDKKAIEWFNYYGIQKITVLK